MSGPDGASYSGYDLVIVGGGPRAVAVVARLAARLRPEAPVGSSPPPGPPALRVAIVDAVEVGAGATWRTDQHELLLNNTYAAHTTAHADSSTEQSGPLVPGPDLVAWAVAARLEGRGDPECGPPRPPWVAAEVAGLRPESYPTRRLQGVYYREQLAEAARRGGIEVLHVLGAAVDIDSTDPAVQHADGPTARLLTDPLRASVEVTGSVTPPTVADLRPESQPRTVRLADARAVAIDGPAGHQVLRPTRPIRALTGERVVLAQGMIQARRSPRIQAFVDGAATSGLVYLEPGMPSERDWDLVPGDGADVLVAGLGANFFDVVGILTAGRGGRFVDARTGAPVDAAGMSTQDGGAGGPAAGAELRYEPSGAEPHLLVGSRRGLPYRGKGAYPASTGGLPPRWVPKLATPRALAAAAEEDARHFGGQLWPLIARELAAAHLLTLLEHHPDSVHAGITANGILAALSGQAEPVAVIEALVTDPVYAIDTDRLDRPAPVEDPEAWQSWVRRWLVQEQASIADPLRSPRNAVNRAMNTLRGQVAVLVREGSIDGAAVVEEVEEWFIPRGLTLSSGPPPRRTAQLLALVRAGVVELLGEHLRVTQEEGTFVARTRVHPEGVRARAFVETRMSKGQVPQTSDPLLQTLLGTGRARLHRRRTAGERGWVVTPSLDVSAQQFALLDAEGGKDERILVLGIPAEALQPGSAIGATPGLPSPLLAGADLAAAQVLQGAPIGV